MNSLAQQLQDKIDRKTKPLGSLGVLETVAFQIASVQNSLDPELKSPHILVFAGSHGLASSAISAYPTEVTPQMVLNFLNGGAAINVFCRQHGISLKIIDAGVDFDFGSRSNLIDAKIAMGTRNSLMEQAMSSWEYALGLKRGADLVSKVALQGSNVIGFGEMGIGNTSAAALIMSKLLNIPIEECVGRGTGLSSQQMNEKVSILRRVIGRHQAVPATAPEVMQAFGGYEMLMICGGMLEAARQNMLILVDGFISSVSYLCALNIMPEVANNAIFCHQSDEKGHKRLLEYLQATPLLNMGMRLGEGTGCAIAYPLLQSAVAFMNEMASFESAGVSTQVS
ncbi:nicotinate-nucleotide--dimethylbenzimidazole phosphoribosyltransferase [Dyadobacter tibetensis]|uniref:nicotinate-nucleotide--dimethylbenzimidazole phosphoribosyltransferase n=1 Tax=Dyadobacter tibetensis TaxID=1211851 RepID=UPI00046F9E0A|nr:nicotinate-nucleotide--dimethylbenzimidazole phosphoribosyltransferase [Dyadobacter tibetensis]